MALLKNPTITITASIPCVSSFGWAENLSPNAVRRGNLMEKCEKIAKVRQKNRTQLGVKAYSVSPEGGLKALRRAHSWL